MDDVLKQIDTILREEIAPTLLGFNWVKAQYAGDFYSTGGYGTDVTYFDDSMELKIPFYQDGHLQRIRELPSSRLLGELLSAYHIGCQQAGTPWNEAKFIMDREGNIEHSFVMNYQRIFQGKIDSINTAASGLAEWVYEHLSGVLPDNTVWEAGSATLTVRARKVAATYSITVGGISQTQPLNLEAWERKMWLEYYDWVDTGVLKGHFPAWNTIAIQLPYEESDFYRGDNVQFLVS